MMVLPKAEELMLGFWLGSIITSVALGLAIVFALHGSKVVNTTRHTVSPDLAVAGLLVLAAIALARGEDKRLRDKHDARHRNEHNGPPKWQQKLREETLGTRSWWASCFPGVWYLAALDRLTKLHYSTVTEIVVVIGFCLVQLALIEIPMLAFKIWPKETPIAIENAKASASRHGRQWAVWGLAIIAGLLAVRGVIGLLR